MPAAAVRPRLCAIKDLAVRSAAHETSEQRETVKKGTTLVVLEKLDLANRSGERIVRARVALAGTPIAETHAGLGWVTFFRGGESYLVTPDEFDVIDQALWRGFLTGTALRRHAKVDELINSNERPDERPHTQTWEATWDGGEAKGGGGPSPQHGTFRMPAPLRLPPPRPRASFFPRPGESFRDHARRNKASSTCLSHNARAPMLILCPNTTQCT